MIILRLTIAALSLIAIIFATQLVHIEAAVRYIGSQEEVPETEIPEFLASAPHDKYGEMIRLGYKLFTQTPLYAKRYVGNELSCTNCHMDAGRRPLAIPMGPAYVAYPTWRQKDDRVNYFDDRIQQCFRYSLNGIPPALGSIELQALTAYASWLAKGLPMGEQMVKGRGLHQIPNTGRDPNHDRGRTIYKDRCAPCHGADGLGTDAAPPLWGMKSYNKGAGMYKIEKMAGFVKKNMPIGDETLTDQEALDVSAYINFQYRPYDPRKGVIGILAR